MSFLSCCDCVHLSDTGNQNESNDPRVGSGRDNATGGTITHISSSGTNSASWSTLGGTFIPVAVYSAVCLLLFLFLRPRCSRVYAARTIPGLLLPQSVLFSHEHDVAPALTQTTVNSVRPCRQAGSTGLSPSFKRRMPSSSTTVPLMASSSSDTSRLLVSSASSGFV